MSPDSQPPPTETPTTYKPNNMAMAVDISISRARVVRLRARRLLVPLAVVAAVAAVLNFHLQLQTTSSVSVALTAEIGDTNGSNATANVVVPPTKTGATPPCHTHVLPLDCASDLCRHVDEYIKCWRDDHGMWHWSQHPKILQVHGREGDSGSRRGRPSAVRRSTCSDSAAASSRSTMSWTLS